MDDEFDPDEQTEPEWREGARLNPTVAALMRRGFDNQRANELHLAGHTLASLKQSPDDALSALGLSPVEQEAVRKGARAEIPFNNLARVLWANRWTCCICREHGRSIIVHHIKPWAQSHDHSEPNLAVLCLEHHARAHTRGDLEQNLTERRLLDAKQRWEQEVRHLDSRAILDASRVDGFHWWWFNHMRVLEMADRLGVQLNQLAAFPTAHRRGHVDENGLIRHPANQQHILYHGGDGTYLYYYMRNVLERVLRQVAIFNITDDLDRSLLRRVARPGDLLLVQGRHVFKRMNNLTSGPGQVSRVRRQANGVRVSFTADRWEAVATSSWATWMVGTQRAASIVRLVDLEREGGHLHLKCTGLAIGNELRGLTTRSYESPTLPIEEPLDDFESDGEWLEDCPQSSETLDET